MSEAYKRAGVDVNAGYEAVRLMKEHVAKTMTPGVVSGIGGFGGLFQPDLSGMSEPVLVSGTDGVGTKLKLAFLSGIHTTVGQDCVAMCVNDIVCCGAKPLFFLDYLAVGKNKPEKVADIVKGVADGCVQAGCALIGGETAEMPGFYPVEDYDLAGFAVGIVDKSRIIDGSGVKEGDALIGIASSGVHSNGFSLVRSVFKLNDDSAGNKLAQRVESLGCTLGEELLKPTKIYVKPLLSLLESMPVKAVSHITGGGFIENIPRMLLTGLTARIYKDSFPVLPIFELIQQEGAISQADMFNTFNMGIGMVLAVDNARADEAVKLLTELGEKAYQIGRVVSGDAGVELV